MYPELVALIGTKAPDYRGRFLRGIQSGHSVGETVANSIKSHNHTQPTHTHSFSGQLVSTALSGTAAGQTGRFTDLSSDRPNIFGNNSHATYLSSQMLNGGSSASTDVFYETHYEWKNSSSSVSGNLRNGTVTGTIAAGGGNPTDYTGETETAPDHIYVRCLIRALP